ncbi:hypothetical protein TCAL_06405 [Tigriopus californicus]|uniref:Uncharacterized protein n=1 Tax=Tigriopus californicus TaxID=6832 RepID=A0A553PAJ0_TIGCA|nr:hypothetical protein TCAL_06405 [Tigriopus californicus]
MAEDDPWVGLLSAIRDERPPLEFCARLLGLDTPVLRLEWAEHVWPRLQTIWLSGLRSLDMDHAPPRTDEEMVLFQLVCLYSAVVKRQCSLTFLLEEGEALNRRSLVEYLSVHGRPSISGPDPPSTPTTRHALRERSGFRSSRTRTRSSPGVYASSPGGRSSGSVSSIHDSEDAPAPSSPLKRFMQSPVTQQVSKYQEIAHQQTRLTLATKVELDQERSENAMLKEDLISARRELENLKGSLQASRSEVYNLKQIDESQELEDVICKLKDELRRKSCQHDCQSLTDQLYDAQSRCQSLEGSLDGIKRKMAEMAQKNASFETQVVNLEIEAKMKVAENERLKESLEELEKLVKDLSDTKKNDSGNGSLMSPLSRRAQRRSMSFSSPENPDQSGEVLADILVPDLEEKLAQSERRNVELSLKLTSIQTKLVEQDQIRMALKNALTTKDKDLKTLEAEKFEIQGKYEHKMVQFEKKMMEVQEERQELNNEFKIKIDSLESEVNHVKSTNAELENDLCQLSKSKDDLMQEYEEFRTSQDKQIQDLNQDRERIVQDLRRAQAQNESIQEEILIKSKESEKIHLDFQTQLNQLSNTNQAMKEKNRELTRDILEKDSKIQKLEHAVVDQTQELNALQQTNNIQEKEMESLQTRFQEIIAERESIKHEMTLAQKKIVDLSLEMADKEMKCEELEKKSQKLDAIQTKNEDLLKEISEIRQQRESQVEEFLQRIQTLEQDNHDVQSKSDLRMQEIQAEKEGLLKDMTEIRHQHESQIEEFRQKIQTLEQDSRDVQSRLDLQIQEILEQKDVLSEQFRNLQTEKNNETKTLEEKLHFLETENREQKQKIEIDSQDLAKLGVEKDALMKQMSETSRNKDLESKQLLETIQSLEAQKREIKTELQTCSQDLDHLREQKTAIEQDLVNLRERNESEIQDLKTAIQSMRSEKQDIQDKLEVQREAFNHIQEENTVLVNRIEETEKAKESESSAFKTQIQALEALNQENENICKRVKKELEQVKTEKEELLDGIAEIRDGKETKFQELLEKIQSLEKTNLEAQEKVDSGEHELRKIQAENVDLTSQMSLIQRQNESELKDLQVKIEALEHRKDEVEANANFNKEELLNTITESQQEAKNLVIKIKSLELDNQKIHSDFVAQGQLLQELEIKHQELLKDHTDLLQKIQTLEKALSDSTQSNTYLAQIQSQYDESKSQVEFLQKMNADLKQDLNQRQSQESKKSLEVQTLSEKLTELSKSVSDKDQDIMALNAALASEKKQFQELQEQLTQTELDLEETRQKVNDVALENRESNEDHTMEIQEIHAKYKEEIQALEQQHKEALNTKVLEIENERTKMTLVNEKLETLLESQDKLQTELRSRIKSEHLKTTAEDNSVKIQELESQLSKAREDFKKIEERNATMKTKYQNKLKEASEEINKKYTEKLDEFQKKFRAENAKLKEERNEAKARVEETLKQYHEEKEKLPSENALKELQKKYETCKKLLVVRQNENDTLKKKLKSAPQLQSLAPAEPPEPNLRRNTIAPQTLKPKDLPKIEVSKFGGSSESVFKCPTNTPGRCKPGRTQSEVAMGRRPPAGYGSMVLMDDEAGEMFSSSYLMDAKSGRCELNSTGGRISELSRRNSMYPAHLQSSYPAETQFYAAKQFRDDDLRSGRLSDVHNLVEKTSQMRVDSPAANTRSRSRITGNPESDINSPNPLPLSIGGRKRRSEAHQNPPDNPFASRSSVQRSSSRSSNSSMVSNDSSLIGVSALKKPKMALATSYSKPGPPTPALKGKRGLHTSFGSHDGTLNRSNRSIAPQDKTHDKTPLLDTTNTSESSINRSSLRSRIIGTPGSLKKVMARAFSTNRKKYNVKRPPSTNGVNGPQENEETVQSDHV